VGDSPVGNRVEGSLVGGSRGEGSLVGDTGLVAEDTEGDSSGAGIPSVGGIVALEVRALEVGI
jgi:hypothetical protein